MGRCVVVGNESKESSKTFGHMVLNAMTKYWDILTETRIYSMAEDYCVR